MVFRILLSEATLLRYALLADRPRRERRDHLRWRRLTASSWSANTMQSRCRNPAHAPLRCVRFGKGALVALLFQ